ncbi:hypothetical protein WJX74_004587 [Apatococcus lobatus]|uniref:Pentatricopeptide repeat-containing protein n=1 Tax=Apatococcus lobatus TaxID=904363 RepID=A0AAW1S3G5_9CHLO
MPAGVHHVDDMASLSGALQHAHDGTGEIRRILLSVSFRPRLPGLTKMISKLSKEGAYRKALEVFYTLAEMDIAVDTAVVNAAISATDRGGQWQSAMEIFGSMDSMGLRRDAITYSSLISALAKGKQWLKALQIFSDMQTRGVQVDVVICCSMISALERGGQWQLAEQVLAIGPITAWRMQLFGLMCEASEFMPPSQPIRGHRNQPHIPHPNQTSPGSAYMKASCAPVLGRPGSASQPTTGLPLEQGPQPFSSLPSYASSYHVSRKRGVMASPFQGAAASLLAAISQPGLTSSYLSDLSDHSALGEAPGAVSNDVTAAPISLDMMRGVSPPEGRIISPSVSSYIGADCGASQMSMAQNGDVPPRVGLGLITPDTQGRKQPQPRSNAKAADWGSKEADVSQHENSAWSEDSPIKAERFAAMSCDTTSDSAPGRAPLGPFHKSPSITRPGGTGTSSGGPSADLELPASGSIKTTPLTEQGMHNAPVVPASDLALNGTRSSSQPAQPVRRNLSADLQAITAPPGRFAGPEPSASITQGRTQPQDNKSISLTAGAHDECWAPAKPGLKWADDDDNETLPLSQTALRFPPLRNAPADADVTSSAAAAFAGLSLGQDSKKQPGSNDQAVINAQDYATPSSSGTKSANGSHVLPPGGPKTWPSCTERQPALGASFSVNPFSPQHMVGMGEASGLSLERSSSSGSASWGLNGSVTRQASTGLMGSGGSLGSGNMSSYMDRAGSGGLPRAGSGMLGISGLAGYLLPVGHAAPNINVLGHGPAPALHLRRALLLPPILASPGKDAAQDAPVQLNLTRTLSVGRIVPNRVCCNCVMAAYARAKPPQFHKALVLLEDMVSLGQEVHPDTVTFNTALKACTNAGRMDVAFETYRAMLRVGGHPSITTFSILLTAANDAGLMSELHTIWGWLEESGLEINAACMNAYLGCLMRQADWSGVQAALLRLLRQGSNRRPPLISINTIMAVLLRQGQHHRVKELFKELLRAHLEPNIVTYNTILRVWADEADAGKAVSLLYHLLKPQATVKPNTATFNAVLSCLAAAALQAEPGADLGQAADDALYFFCCMADSSFADVDATSYSCIITGFEMDSDMRRVVVKEHYRRGDVVQALRESDGLDLDEDTLCALATHCVTSAASSAQVVCLYALSHPIVLHERPEQSLLMAQQYRHGQGTVVLQTALRTALSGGVLGRQTALLVTASLVSLLHRSDHAAVILQAWVRHGLVPDAALVTATLAGLDVSHVAAALNLMMLLQLGDVGTGELGIEYTGEAGLLWLAPIRVQGCGALATTVMMLTWLTALMQCLQSGCKVASTTIIIATGQCEGDKEANVGTKQAVLSLCAGQEQPDNPASTAFLALCRSQAEAGPDVASNPALPCTHDSHGNLEFSLESLIERIKLYLPALSLFL